jgi:hypothetical protein
LDRGDFTLRAALALTSGVMPGTLVAGSPATSRHVGGDGVSRLDRIETALNEAIPGDPRESLAP